MLRATIDTSSVPEGFAGMQSRLDGWVLGGDSGGDSTILPALAYDPAGRTHRVDFCPHKDGRDFAQRPSYNKVYCNVRLWIESECEASGGELQGPGIGKMFVYPFGTAVDSDVCACDAGDVTSALPQCTETTGMCSKQVEKNVFSPAAVVGDRLPQVFEESILGDSITIKCLSFEDDQAKQAINGNGSDNPCSVCY